jgi:OmpA-OmpF porin, OOP family
MVNALYDFSLSPWGIDLFTPYVGAGAGYAWQNMRSFNISSYPNPATYYGQFHQDEGSFAAQGIVGAAINIPQVPGLALTAEYRVFAKIGSDTYHGFYLTPGTGAAKGTVVRTPGSVKLGDELNHSALIGFRYAFNVAPPPPPVVPPVVVPPTRSYLVFFDWDKATLTERARQIIREAADASTKVQYTRIEVNGYTDTSGTPRYNQGLSVRRAEAVAAELVRDGVPRNAISIQGFGETHLLVPTGPGVREPQNRRVEIIIR